MPEPVAVAAAERLGGRELPLVDRYVLPVRLDNRDIALFGAAPTGAEQVAPLVLPLIAQLTASKVARPPPAAPRGLVLAPTRELAAFAADKAQSLARGTPLRCAHAYGGAPAEGALDATSVVDVLVATPGRLLELLERGAASLKHVRSLVIAGLDALFDRGFEHDLRRLVLDEGMPPNRQIAISCAGLSAHARLVAEHIMRPNAVWINLPGANLASCCVPSARQHVKFAEDATKAAAVAALVRGSSDGLCLVIVSSRRLCEMIVYSLQGEGLGAAGFALERPKHKEKNAMLASYSSGATKVLVVTDASLRGFIDELPPLVGHVINLNPPSTLAEYASRLSITARHGRSGACTTIISESTPHDQA